MIFGSAQDAVHNRHDKRQNDQNHAVDHGQIQSGKNRPFHPLGCERRDSNEPRIDQRVDDKKIQSQSTVKSSGLQCGFGFHGADSRGRRPR